MKTHEKPQIGRIWGILLLVFSLALVLAGAPSGAEGSSAPYPAAGTDPPCASKEKEAVRVYTNADLAALGPVPGSKGPISDASQPAPLPGERTLPAVDMESWGFVLAMIDRERAYEEQRRQREMASNAAAAAAAAATEREQSSYSYYLPYSYHPFPPIFDPTPSVPVPSNPYVSLRARGIRTAQDLFRESVRDSKIRRQSLP